MMAKNRKYFAIQVGESRYIREIHDLGHRGHEIELTTELKYCWCNTSWLVSDVIRQKLVNRGLIDSESEVISL